MSGAHYHPDDGYTDIITENFETQEAAAKCVVEILQDTFPTHKRSFTVKNCMDGADFCSDGTDEWVKLEIVAIDIPVPRES